MVVFPRDSFLENSGLDDKFRGRCTFINFHPNGGCAMGAEIFIFIPVRQHQKQFLTDRNRGFTSGAVE